VDWAELVTIDLSKFDTPGGKEELVKELEYAVTNVGKCDSATPPSTWESTTEIVQASSM
jgi:hypothetical protein